MTWTTDDLTAIETAIKSGTLRVKYADREVMYRSLDELVRIRDMIKDDLGQLGDNHGRSRRYFEYSKGL